MEVANGRTQPPRVPAVDTLTRIGSAPGQPLICSLTVRSQKVFRESRRDLSVNPKQIGTSEQKHVPSLSVH